MINKKKNENKKKFDFWVKAVSIGSAGTKCEYKNAKLLANCSTVLAL